MGRAPLWGARANPWHRKRLSLDYRSVVQSVTEPTLKDWVMLFNLVLCEGILVWEAAEEEYKEKVKPRSPGTHLSC